MIFVGCHLSLDAVSTCCLRNQSVRLTPALIPPSVEALALPMRMLHSTNSVWILFCLLVIASTSGPSFGDSSPLVDNIDWRSVLADYNLRWTRFPKKWDEAPFLGNGEQGTLLYQLNKRTLRWDVGCSAAHDHRPFEKDDLSEKNVVVLNRGRLFIGHIEVRSPVDLKAMTGRLSLWDAQASGTFTAQRGIARWKTLVHANEPVMYFEMQSQGALSEIDFAYVPEEARSPRAVRAKSQRKPANPPAVLSKGPGEVQTAVHQLHSGGQTAVAWLKKKSRGSVRLWVSVQHSYPGDEALNAAVTAVQAAADADHKEWIARHQAWWHEYYPQSFVSTGDPYWDPFYWIQQYKLGCATRDRGWIIDNQGPWLQPTAWNATWWNLNVQVSHSGVYTANRRGQATALSHRLDVCRDSLALSVAEPFRHDSYAIGRTASGWDLLGHAGQPGGRKPIHNGTDKECGNLLWALHNVDTEYRYWLDVELRDTVLYPLLTRAVNYYRHFLQVGKDGKLHLPQTYSPELRNAKDCTYDLDLLHWGVSRLLELAEEKQMKPADEPLIEVWRDLKARLAPVNTDKTGRMIGSGAPLRGRHRHWSHLLAIYPLRTLTPDSDADRDLIRTSLEHWQSFGLGVGGYACTGGSCMSSILGDGDMSLEYLNRLRRFVKPNTFYSEIGLPVMETPLHGATAMQEMLLQSWGEALHVFPAVPSAWPDIMFAHLRGEGAFLVSASREKGECRWVLIEAEQGGTTKVAVDLHDVDYRGSAGSKLRKVESGLYEITTEPEGWILIWPKGKPEPTPASKAIDSREPVQTFGLP